LKLRVGGAGFGLLAFVDRGLLLLLLLVPSMPFSLFAIQILLLVKLLKTLLLDPFEKVQRKQNQTLALVETIIKTVLDYHKPNVLIYALQTVFLNVG